MPPPRWTPAAWFAIGLLGVLLGVIRAESPLGDSDVLWGARGGLDMLHNGHVPTLDYYSWTMAGKAWIPNSWGWNLVLGLAYRTGGIGAIFGLGVILAGLLGLVVGWAAWRIGADPARTFIVFATLGLLMRFALYARPQIVDYFAVLILPALVAPVLCADRPRAVRAAVAVCLAQVFWINLHTSAVLGPVIVGAAGIGVVVLHRSDPHRRRMLSRLVALSLVAAMCCLATPYGTSLITHIGEVRSASAGYINEWQPAGFSGALPVLALVAIVLGLVAAYLATRRQRLEITAALIVFCIAAGAVSRFSPMLVMLTVPEYACALGKLELRPTMAKRIAALGALTMILLAASGLSHFAEPGGSVWSPRLVSTLPRGCRVLNDYAIGGEILLTRPDVRVSWDGRNDLYGKQVELQVVSYLDDKPGTEEALDSAHVNCVLANMSDPIVSALSHRRGWRVAGTEGSRTLLLRVAS